MVRMGIIAGTSSAARLGLVLAGCCEMETTSRVKESEKFREYVKEQDAVRGKGRQI